MKELTKWQIISFISRSLAQVLGIIQSIIIWRILTVGEYGLVQIAVSIGAVFGIYQHLGLASGSTREISAAKNDTERFKIFLTALVIRYIVTIPLAIWLFLWSRNLAVNTYSEPSLTTPLKMFALVLILQGVQSILNSVLMGTQRFKQLFIYQVGIAFVSILLFVPLVKMYKINGYFYAMVLFNLVSSIILWIVAFKPMKFKMVLPNKQDFKTLFKDLVSISVVIYVVKILYTMWEKSGPILLGVRVTKEMVGIFAFAMLFSKKLLSISDSVTDVSLPVFSEKYVNDFHNFKTLFTENFNKLYAIIVFVGFSAVFWSKEIIHIVIGGTKYDQAFPFILPMLFAFVFYSFSNIVTSSITVPARMMKTMIVSFGCLLISTIAFYFVFSVNLGPMPAMAYGMVFGSFVSFLCLTLLSQSKLKFVFFNHDHVLLLLQGLVISLAAGIQSVPLKIGAFVLFALLYAWAVLASKFVEKRDFAFAFDHVGRIYKKISKTNQK